mgnify:CR=1 FL=1
MNNFKQKMAISIQTCSEKIVKTVVGKSMLFGTYEMNLPDEVTCWIREEKLNVKKK